MAKQREVEKQFHGRAKNENYYEAMEKARAAGLTDADLAALKEG